MRALGLLAIASVAYFVVAVTAMHLLQPGLDPLTVPMSAYVLGAYGGVMTSTFHALAVGLMAVSIGLLRAFPRSPLAKVGFALMLVASVGVVVAALFPTDWPPPFVSESARVHQLAAMIAFPAMTIAPGLFSLPFRRDAAWRRVAAIALSLAAGLVAVELFLLGTASVGFLGVGGLAQRLFLALLLGWVFVVARQLMRS